MSHRANQLHVNWFSSSYSNDQGGQCVQGAHCDNGDMAVRDSKVPDGAAFRFGPQAWQSFISNVKHAG
ncbi:DUF397 domain-containing protein [Streptomyces sp. H27-H1]|uniref:DUF397 domain-containing protein n=1 Tax=unclassified Streptomyces TaxID=2593676 RepID=UPI00226D9135|nr:MULTISPECIES: DUF397 domain-containing protein [unclassified Streptomyces]MCY0929496.1 DUF397 domain-containing protein [Streptomyces sp. H27-H1]MCY0938835.1 DUF397 domain-containing protein [Streptomyces sp. H34-S4]